jgi:hypothetical protein
MRTKYKVKVSRWKGQNLLYIIYTKLFNKKTDTLAKCVRMEKVGLTPLIWDKVNLTRNINKNKKGNFISRSIYYEDMVTLNVYTHS